MGTITAPPPPSLSGTSSGSHSPFIPVVIGIGCGLLVGAAIGYSVGRSSVSTGSSVGVSQPSGRRASEEGTFVPAKFERLYRSGKTIDAALSVGVNRQRFHELLQDFTAELSIVSAQGASAAERIVLSSYQSAGSVLSDIAAVWQAETTASGFFVAVGDNPNRAIANKYHLKSIVGEDIDAEHAHLITGAAQQIMAHASRALQAAAKLYEERAFPGAATGDRK